MTDRTPRAGEDGGCGRFERLTLAAAEGEALPPDAVAFLRDHAGACAACGALARADHAVAAASGDEGWAGGLDELTAHRVLRRAVEQRPRPSAARTAPAKPARAGARRRRESRRWAVAAASAAAALLVGGWALTAAYQGRGPEPARATLVNVLAWPSPALALDRGALALNAGPVRPEAPRPAVREAAGPVARVEPGPAPDRASARQTETDIRRAQAARRQAQLLAAEAERSERLARLEAERAKQRLEKLLVREREELARQKAQRSRIIILDLPES